jgi:ParB family transcriptional regulator, chromosome partitioning protein
MPQQIEVPFSKLKRDPSNVRKTDVEPSKQFVASVREEGILEPLTVRPNGDGYFVFGGGKRLAALGILAKEKLITPDHPVPCIIREIDEQEARNIGLAINLMRDDMHPVDEYEAFADFVKDGMTPDQIGKKYGMTIREVGRVLALGSLAPEVRALWREDKIQADAARAFTLEPDQKRQAEILISLRKRGGLHAHTVKAAIVGDEREAKAMINFVGIEAYKTVGGATTTDLFADAKDPVAVATDLKLLKKLYDEKLKTKLKELEEEGWKWIAFQSDLGYQAQYWSSKPKNQVKADERGKFGVIISKGHFGDIEIKYGVTKPAEEKAAAKKKVAKKAGVTAVALSAALCGRLNDQITQATASVLEHDSHLGLIAVCAAMTSAAHEGAALAIRSEAHGTAKFLAQFEVMRKKSVAELHAVIAKVASQSLSIGGSIQDRLPLSKNRPGDRALLEALDAKKLNAALRASFEPADYFAGVTAQVCKDAIALCDPKQPITGKEKKSELAKLATDLVKKSNAGGKAGYLPPEMRTAHYDGPAPKKAAPAAKAKAVKKRAR